VQPHEFIDLPPPPVVENIPDAPSAVIVVAVIAIAVVVACLLYFTVLCR
jgi:hypothetical protein